MEEAERKETKMLEEMISQELMGLLRCDSHVTIDLKDSLDPGELLLACTESYSLPTSFYIGAH